MIDDAQPAGIGDQRRKSMPSMLPQRKAAPPPSAVYAAEADAALADRRSGRRRCNACHRQLHLDNEGLFDFAVITLGLAQLAQFGIELASRFVAAAVADQWFEGLSRVSPALKYY